MSNIPLLIWTIFLWLIPTGIYIDATTSQIGRLSNEKRGFLKQWFAGEWGLCGVFLGPIALMLYLGVRKRLVNHARQHPVYIKIWQGVIVASLLLLVSVPYLTMYHVIIK